jgi:hypothetical protein
MSTEQEVLVHITNLDKALSAGQTATAQSLIKRVSEFGEKHGILLDDPDNITNALFELLEIKNLATSAGEQTLLELLKVVYAFSVFSLFQNVQQKKDFNAYIRKRVLNNLTSIEQNAKQWKNEEITMEATCIRESVTSGKQSNDWLKRMSALKDNALRAKKDGSASSLQDIITVVSENKNDSSYEELLNQLNILQDVALNSQFPMVRRMATENIIKHFANFQDKNMSVQKRVGIRRRTLTALGRIALEARDYQAQSAAAAAITDRLLLESDESLRIQTAKISQEANVDISKYLTGIKERLESQYEKLLVVKQAIQENKDLAQEIQGLIREREKEIIASSDTNRHQKLKDEIIALQDKANQVYYDKQRRFNVEWDYFNQQSTRFKELTTQINSKLTLGPFDNLRENVQG